MLSPPTTVPYVSFMRGMLQIRLRASRVALFRRLNGVAPYLPRMKLNDRGNRKCNHYRSNHDIKFAKLKTQRNDSPVIYTRSNPSAKRTPNNCVVGGGWHLSNDRIVSSS
jgi:hypothetical protein